MSEVLRLIRLSLIMRLIPTVLAVLPLPFASASGFLLIPLVSALPSLIILLLAWVVAHRKPIQPRPVQTILLLAIVAYAAESLLPLVALRLTPFSTLLPPEFVQRMLVASDFGGRARPFVNIVLLFTLIPTILGAWMSGSRGALRWAGFAILVNFVIEGVWLVLGRTAPANESSSHWFTFGGFLAQSIVMVMVCYFVGVLADRQRTEHAQLEHANTLLIEQTHMREQLAASQERMRLSRDLHDTVAHTLAALSVQMNAVSAVLEGEQPTIAVRRELDVARTLVKEGLENTRRAITDLRVNQVADFGLSGALQKQTEALAQRTGIEATFERLGPEPTLSDDVADTIFRIAQEALNNVEMHAAAQRVVVVLDHHVTKPRKVMLTIQDDGRGFDVDEILDTERFGLRGMRERAQLIGAHLRVDSQSHTGTKVILDLKL